MDLKALAGLVRKRQPLAYPADTPPTGPGRANDEFIRSAVLPALRDASDALAPYASRKVGILLTEGLVQSLGTYPPNKRPSSIAGWPFLLNLF